MAVLWGTSPYMDPVFVEGHGEPGRIREDFSRPLVMCPPQTLGGSGSEVFVVVLCAWNLDSWWSGSDAISQYLGHDGRNTEFNVV